MRFRSTLSLLAFCPIAAYSQVALNQVDTFTDLSTAFWSGGANPQVIATGGPSGGGDAFLQINSIGGFGVGSHCATYNNLQWAGNYQSAGVKVIRCHLNNLGSTTLFMRLVFIDQNLGQWTTVNTNSISLPANSGWVLATYSIKESDWVRVSGTETWNGITTNAGRLMFRHDPGSPNSGGEAVVGTLGIDNIQALSGIPVEPTSYTVDAGLNFGGTLASLRLSDNDSVIVLNDENDSTGQVTVTGVSSLLTPSSIQVTLESAATRNDLSEFLSAFNYSTNGYTNVAFRTTTLADFVSLGTISANASQYVSGSGNVRVRVVWIPQADIDAGDGWAERIDQVRWSLAP